MTPLPALTRSQRVALLGGVSLIALQGLSACSGKAVPTTTTYAPQVNVPVAPVPADEYVAQGYGVTDGMATTLALGEEDGGVGYGVEPTPYTTTGPVSYDSGVATTLAIGEEDGGTGPYTEIGPVGNDFGQSYTPSYDSGMATTLAVGEEDGSGPIPVEPDGGIGDGAGPIPFDYTAPPPLDSYTPSYDTGGTVTTFAIGEEDGSGPMPVEPDGGIGDGAGPPPFATTYAIGEETGGGYGQPLGTDMMTTLAIGEEG